MAAQAVTLFIGRRTCSSSGGGTGRTMKRPNIMGNEEPNERSRNGDALPVRNKHMGDSRKRKADSP